MTVMYEYKEYVARRLHGDIGEYVGAYLGDHSAHPVGETWELTRDDHIVGYAVRMPLPLIVGSHQDGQSCAPHMTWLILDATGRKVLHNSVSIADALVHLPYLNA